MWRRVFLMSLVVAGAGWAAWNWLPAEERRIERRLAALAGAVSVTGAESATTRLAQAARIGGFFTEDVALDPGSPYQAVHGRDAIVALAARVRSANDRVRLEFLDVEIRLAEDRTSATAHMTARVTGLDPARGARGMDARELEMTLVRRGDEWLISRVEAVRALERPY